MSQFPGNGKFEVIVPYMEVTLVHDHQFAHNKISLTSIEAKGRNIEILALEAKLGLLQNDLFATSSVKMLLQYDISMRVN